MKLKLLLLSSLFCFCLQADEFVEAGTSLGGYGELHWDKQNGKLDFHRFILFVNHTWDDKWSLKSEIEIEHNMVGSYYDDCTIDDDANGDGTEICNEGGALSTNGKGGYVAMEQAYVNYNGGNWNAKMGVILAPVGIINEMHEPPTFLSVERPSYHGYIIPTTWFDNGFGADYNFGDWSVGLTMLGDLNGHAMTGDGKSNVDGAYSFKYARQKGYNSMAHNLTQIINFDYTGVDGLHIGGSKTTNDMPEVVETINDEKKVTKDVGLDMTEFHLQYMKHNVWARFETATVDFDFSNSTDPNLKKSSEGNYFELGYNVGSLMPGDCDLVLWTRQSTWDSNTHKDNSKNVGDVSESLMGITWWPNDQVSFKIDSGSKDVDYMDNGVKTTKSTDMMNIGVGYMF